MPFSMPQLAAMIRVLRDVFVSLHMERPLKQSSSRPEPFEWRCLKKVELARWNIGPGRHFMLDVPEGGMSHRHVHATFFCLCSVSTDCCAYCMSVIVAVPSAHLTTGWPYACRRYRLSCSWKIVKVCYVQGHSSWSFWCKTGLSLKTVAVNVRTVYVYITPR